jgi:hypothetical protein
MHRVWVASLVALTLAAAQIAAVRAGEFSGGVDEREHMAVFGFVRDARGAAVSGAMVTADFKTIRVKLVAQSDVTGAFAIPKIDEAEDKSEVSITCAKDGFRFDKEIPRHLEPKPGQPAEIDCILARK